MEEALGRQRSEKSRLIKVEESGRARIELCTVINRRREIDFAARRWASVLGAFNGTGGGVKRGFRRTAIAATSGTPLLGGVGSSIHMREGWTKGWYIRGAEERIVEAVNTWTGAVWSWTSSIYQGMGL